MLAALTVAAVARDLGGTTPMTANQAVRRHAYPSSRALWSLTVSLGIRGGCRRLTVRRRAAGFKVAALPSPRLGARFRQPPAGALFGLSTTPDPHKEGTKNELGRISLRV